MVYGINFVTAYARNADHRVILDWEHVPTGKGGGGEGAAVQRTAKRLAEVIPDIRGIIFDKALRGRHIDWLMQEVGWITIAKVHARRNPGHGKGRARGPRIPKDRLIEIRTFRDGEGREVTIRIHARDGAAGIIELDETGTAVFLPLRRTKTLRRPNKGGYRFYNEYELPKWYGAGLIRVRLTGNEEDRRRGLNRAENLRAIPPSDPDFKRLIGRRNDAESNNNTFNDTLYGKRAHSVGAVGQDLDMLGYALLSNARVHARLVALGLKPAA